MEFRSVRSVYRRGRCALEVQPLFRLLIVNLLLGLAASVVLVIGILAFDIGHLRTLIMADDGYMPVVILSASFAFTFGSLAMGFAVMIHRYDRGRPPTGRHSWVPIPVRAVYRKG